MIDILIPAYSKPNELGRCLSSILMQTYRPINIIIGDDNSSVGLEEVVFSFGKIADKGIIIEYTKHAVNLRPYWNIGWLLHRAKSDFLVMMPHDDFFIDTNFISDACERLERTQENVYIANTQIEHSLECMMDLSFNATVSVGGYRFAANELWSKAHPAYSAVVFRRKVITLYLESGFHHDRTKCKALNFEPDEGFTNIILGCIDKSLSITGKIVSVRGVSQDSYSRSDYWKENVNECLFLTYFQLLLFGVKVGNENIKQIALRNLVSRYPHKGSFDKIISYFGDSHLIREVIKHVQKK